MGLEIIGGLKTSWPARNGTPNANADNLTLPDGRRLFAGPAQATDGAPPRPIN